VSECIALLTLTIVSLNTYTLALLALFRASFCVCVNRFSLPNTRFYKHFLIIFACSFPGIILYLTHMSSPLTLVNLNTFALFLVALLRVSFCLNVSHFSPYSSFLSTISNYPCLPLSAYHSGSLCIDLLYLILVFLNTFQSFLNVLFQVSFSDSIKRSSLLYPWIIRHFPINLASSFSV
jgi:hypothetical protein